MHVKKERTHQCGLSNIDFRRLNDKQGIQRFQDDMRSTNFGLMGRNGIHNQVNSSDYNRRESLQLHSGFKMPEPPNPRNDTAKNFYAKTKKPFMKPASVQKARITHLEDPVWNEKVFTGEDVGGLTWYNNRVLGTQSDQLPASPRGQKRILKNILKNVANAIRLRKGDKLEKHEKALQETQLVKVKNKETLEGKVDIQKVKEIRRTIRRRYGNRSNFHKIFNAWDRHRKGYVDTSDLHYMINHMGININSQEAQVLMASHDHNANQKLTMDEFMDLIFSSDDNMNVNLSKIKLGGEIMEIEPNEDIMQGIRKDAAKLKKLKEESQFKCILQKSLKELYKDFVESDKEKTREIDYNTFERAIGAKLALPGYLKERKDLYMSIFNEFDNKKNGKINYQQFLESIKSFHYLGESEINMDLGPATEQAGPHAKPAVQEKIDKKAQFLSKDANKVTATELEKIVDRTLKVSRLLQAKFGTQEKLDEELKGKVKFDTYGNASQPDLEAYLIEACKDNLNKREIARKDIEGFLSSLVYNKYKMTDLRSLPQQVFSDDTKISKKIYSFERPMPPPASIAESIIKGNQSEEPVSNERMRSIIKELQHKSFADKKYAYGIFKEFDHDCDGKLK